MEQDKIKRRKNIKEQGQETHIDKETHVFSHRGVPQKCEPEDIIYTQRTCKVREKSALTPHYETANFQGCS